MSSLKPPLKIKHLNNGFVEVEFSKFEHRHIGKKVTLEFYRCVDVLVKNGNDIKTRIYSTDFIANSSTKILRENINVESYSGKNLRIYHTVVLTVDDALIFNSKYEQVVNTQIIKDYNVSYELSKRIIEPIDNYNLVKNFNLLSSNNKLLILGMSGTCFILGTINLLIGYHDELSSELGTWIYSSYNSKGESTTLSPVASALAISLFLFVTGCGYVKYILKKYMTFRAKVDLSIISAETKIMAKDLIGGVSKVELKDVRFRVVAGNIERGSYESDDGEFTGNRRTIVFKRPVNSIVLYEERIMYIPAMMELSDILKGEVDFSEIFNTLHPELMSLQTGVETYWEIQLIHDGLKNQTIPMKNTYFSPEDFKKVG